MTNKGNSIGFIYCAQDFTTLKKIFSNDYFHINNISKHFKKIYILNLTNLYFFKKKIKNTQKLFKKYNFRKNIIFINPDNINEFKKFFNSRSFLAILCMRRTISELFIYFSFKKNEYKIFSNF